MHRLRPTVFRDEVNVIASKARTVPTAEPQRKEVSVASSRVRSILFNGGRTNCLHLRRRGSHFRSSQDSLPCFERSPVAVVTTALTCLRGARYLLDRKRANMASFKSIEGNKWRSTNLLERWFGEVTERCVRRDSHTTVRATCEIGQAASC
jgi:hypothetical protein